MELLQKRKKGADWCSMGGERERGPKSLWGKKDQQAIWDSRKQKRPAKRGTIGPGEQRSHCLIGTGARKTLHHKKKQNHARFTH